MMTAYTALEDRFRRLSALGDAVGILNWDFQTLMPPGAAEARAEQQALLRAIAHEELTDPAMGELLDEASADSLEAWQAANLREMRRSWRHATAVPADLVAANSKATSHCELVWRAAREAGDFAQLLPSLREVLACQRALAAAKGDHLGLAPYDALLDVYEPGATAARINPLFAALERDLPGLIDRICARQDAQPAPLVPPGPFPVAQQRALARIFMERLGFDFERGRLDVSVHPFCGGATDDVRITTRYDETDFASSLLAVLHETGHALYEQNRPRAWRMQPVGRARSMAVHESQSLLVEMQVCRSRAFMTFAAPLIRDAFGREGAAWTADNLYRSNIRVQRGFIRVDADEATYPAHVILRTEIEQALISGDLPLEDLPGAWNDGLCRLLGLTPPDDRWGCLQDIHWPTGAFGYFPTYTLGAMAAAQLFASARRARAGLLDDIARGDFAPLLAWLREAVYTQASFPASSDALLLHATGEPLNPKIFFDHLERRYLSDDGAV